MRYKLVRQVVEAFVFSRNVQHELSNSDYARAKMRHMVKLSEGKIRWIVQEKLRGRRTGELALIQRVSRRRVEQLWQTYRRTGIVPALKKPGTPRKAATNLRDAATVMKAYDELKVNALTLEYALKQSYGLNLPHNRIHAILKETGRALN